MFLLCAELFADQRLAFLSALIFAAHPIHTEAVSWISGGPYALSGALFILALLFYVKAGNSLPNLLLAVAFFCLCVLSSSTAAALPLAFLFYELFFRGGEGGRLRRIRLAVLAALAFFFLKAWGLINPRQPHVWCNLGMAYREKKDFKMAEFCYREALKLDRGFPAAKQALEAMRPA